MISSRRIAVIGGGASAAILAANIAKGVREGAAVEIDIYDRRGNFPRGVAYGTEFSSHCLNVRAANMSAFMDDAEHFARWAAGHSGYAPEDFVPRIVFGKYLDSIVEEAREKISVRVIGADVHACERTAEGFSVVTNDGSKTYDIAVQASGNVRLIQPRCAESVTGYAAEPWFVSSYEDIPQDGRVVLIGSGLSAADAVGSLFERGFDGEIVIVSRNGWMPCGHVPPAKYPPFVAEEEIALPPSKMMRRIRAEVRKAAGEGVSWHAVIDSLRGTTNKTWQAWGMRERSIFLRRAFTAWNIHRHRMSPETAARIASYQNAGKLRFVKDSVLSVEAPCVVRCAKQDIAADAVINCMGYRYEEGRAFDVLHRIGPSRFGELFETTAIPEVRAQAGEIAARILSACK